MRPWHNFPLEKPTVFWSSSVFLLLWAIKLADGASQYVELPLHDGVLYFQDRLSGFDHWDHSDHWSLSSKQNGKQTDVWLITKWSCQGLSFNVSLILFEENCSFVSCLISRTFIISVICRIIFFFLYTIGIYLGYTVLHQGGVGWGWERGSTGFLLDLSGKGPTSKWLNEVAVSIR